MKFKIYEKNYLFDIQIKIIYNKKYLSKIIYTNNYLSKIILIIIKKIRNINFYKLFKI